MMNSLGRIEASEVTDMYISEQVCDEILRDTYVAAPCNVGWENMNGDDRVRACAQCQQNVYNTLWCHLFFDRGASRSCPPSLQLAKPILVLSAWK
ncbi:hypothetical protein KF728_00545 [Candidatus Obscuribacterales bacterium]|nr:hypothetical protein [Candidatus Obscuribacterales bacterium]